MFILQPSHTAVENPDDVWEAAPTVCTVVICIASFLGSPNGFEFEHQREVGSVSGEVLLSPDATQPLSAQLLSNLRFLSFPLPASPSVHLAVYFPFPGSDTGLPCSVEMTP